MQNQKGSGFSRVSEGEEGGEDRADAMENWIFNVVLSGKAEWKIVGSGN